MDSTRELYKQKAEAQMREWHAKLEVMKAQSEKLSAQAKIDVKPHVDAVHARLDAAKSKLAEMGAVTTDKVNEAVAELDRAWNDVKAAAEAALDVMKRHDKKN